MQTRTRALGQPLPSYLRIKGQLLHRETILSIRPGKTLFLRRPCLRIDHESPQFGRFYMIGWWWPVAIPWNARGFRTSYMTIRFETEAERDYYLIHLQHVCPNLVDGEPDPFETEMEGLGWRWRYPEHIEELDQKVVEEVEEK